MHTSQQTEPFVAKDVELQTSYTTNREVQTKGFAFNCDSHKVHYDSENLLGFLRRVAPIMLRQIESNSQSHAFDSYDLNSVDGSGEKLILLHTLTCPDVGDEMQCTNISWNSTGNVVAVTYGALLHDGWCTHISRVAIWNLNQRDFCESKPTVFIEASACLTCVQFHPRKPALIVGGSHNGHVFLWDLSRDDLLVASTATNDFGHGESVTSLHWIKERDLNLRYLLVSSGLDGKILLWKFSERSSQFKLIKGFLVLAENLPRALRHGSSSRRTGEVGVTGLSFCDDDSDLFFAAVEGGGLIQCSLDSQLHATGTIGRKDADVPLLSPIVLAFMPHVGHISSISCSPFEHHLVASCGSDGELRVYSLMQPNGPVVTAHHSTALESLCWSPVRPLVIASVSSGGEILFFNVQTAQFGPEFRFVMDEGEFCKLVFNHKELMATASKLNKTQVWQLGAEYSVYSSYELKIANELAKIHVL